MKLRQGNPEEVGMSSERVQRIINLAKGWVDRGDTQAIVMLVARKGVVVLYEAIGHLTPEPDSHPVLLDTIFPIACLTKPITATSVMILVEDGLLGINRPVSYYIPEFIGEDKDKVMVHHLLTHTSGIRDADVDKHAEERKGSIEIPSPDKNQDPEINEYLFLRYDTPLWKKPGEEMSYSSWGYHTLREIVRRISGEKPDDFARKRIFEPLEMKDTYSNVPDSKKYRIVKRPKNAPIYEWFETIAEKGSYWHDATFSTVMDMAIFGQMFLNKGTYGETRIISPMTVSAMTRNQIPGISAWEDGEFFPEAEWGLGWSIHGTKKSLAYGEILSSPESVCHGGGGGVLLWVDPTYDVVASFFFVTLDNSPENALKKWHGDLVINSAMAAITEV